MNPYCRLQSLMANVITWGREKKKIGPNTWAIFCDGGIMVEYHHTPILHATPDGLMKVLSSYNSFTTRVRHNEWMPSGWGTFQQQNEAYLHGRGCAETGFLLPLERGLMTGWDVTPSHVRLNLRMRLGQPEAALELATWFDAQGWTSMAQTCRSLKGQRFGMGYRRAKAALAALEENEHDPEGRWFVDASTGVMVRAVTLDDVYLWGVPKTGVSNEPLTMLGRELLIVDGFDYSARTGT